MSKIERSVKRESVDNGERRRFEDTSPYMPNQDLPARQATKPPVPMWILLLLVIVVMVIAYSVARHLARH